MADYTQDKAFLSASPTEKHQFLMETDSAYAKASPQDQQAFLSRFASSGPFSSIRTGQPEIDTVLENPSSLLTALGLASSMGAGNLAARYATGRAGQMLAPAAARIATNTAFSGGQAALEGRPVGPELGKTAGVTAATELALPVGLRFLARIMGVSFSQHR